MAKDKMPTHEFTTRPGAAVWPHLHAPDTKYDANGVYKTGVALDPEEAQPLLDLIKKTLQETKAHEGTKKEAPYSPFEQQEDGKYVFQFKMKAQGVRQDGTKWTNRPAIFDAKGKKVPNGLRIGGGSRIRVAGVAKGYNGFGGCGVTLYMNAVQVIKLETFGGTADSYGFEPSEEGFSADEANEAWFDDSEDDLDDGGAPEGDAGDGDF